MRQEQYTGRCYHPGCLQQPTRYALDGRGYCAAHGDLGAATLTPSSIPAYFRHLLSEHVSAKAGTPGTRGPRQQKSPNALLVSWILTSGNWHRFEQVGSISGGDRAGGVPPATLATVTTADWDDWGATVMDSWLRLPDGPRATPVYYVATYVLNGAMHCVTSPGFPMTGNSPDSRAFLGLPSEWPASPETPALSDEPGLGDEETLQDLLPRVLDAFPGGVGTLPNNPITAANRGAIWHGGKLAFKLEGGWELSETRRPFFTHGGDRGRVRVSISPSDDVDTLLSPDDLIAKVKLLNPLTQDVARMVLAQLGNPTAGTRPHWPLLEPVLITEDAMLKYKGFDRYGIERRKLRERLRQEMELLGALRFELEDYKIGHPSAHRRSSISYSGRLFDVETVRMYQESLLGERTVTGMAWSVRAGQWAKYFLSAAGRVWLAQTSQTLLELDHTRGVPLMAKKIGEYLTDLTPIVPRLEPLIIGHLLAQIGELPQERFRTKDWAGVTRDQFDAAMNLLQLRAVFSSVAWPDGYGPDDRDRVKGWVPKWLSSHVTIQVVPAGGLKNDRMLSRTKRGPVSKPPAAAQLVDGPAIRRARTERNWHQTALAKYLGVTVPYLSQIETGKRHPSIELAARIRAWLTKPLCADE